MVIGIGTDIIEIERIKNLCLKNERFIFKTFTENEMSLFGDNLDRYSTIAGNFAAKEACTKVFGTGITGLNWKDMEILRDPAGKPLVNLHGNALKIAESMGIKKIFISISHCREYAVAYGLGTGGIDNEGSI